MEWNTIKRLLNSLSIQSVTDLQKEIRRADEWVTKAIAADPNLYLLHEIKAWVLILQKRPEEAIIAAERSLALNPSFVYAYQPWL